jgi:hypothetical protein
MIIDGVAGDDEKPTFEVGDVLQFIAVVPDPDKDVLDALGGLVLVAEIEHGDLVDALRVTSVQAGERILIACSGETEQVLFGIVGGYGQTYIKRYFGSAIYRKGADDWKEG